MTALSVLLLSRTGLLRQVAPQVLARMNVLSTVVGQSDLVWVPGH